MYSTAAISCAYYPCILYLAIIGFPLHAVYPITVDQQLFLIGEALLLCESHQMIMLRGAR